MVTTTKSTVVWIPVLVVSALSAGSTIAGSGQPADPFSVPKTADVIEIDGDLTEEAWNDALVVLVNVEISPRDNVPATVTTEALFLYDTHHVYVAFRCFDPDPAAIRAYLRDRDTLGDDDWVAIELDTYNDQRHAFTLFSTPFGIQVDGLSDAAGVKDYSWDTIYHSAGSITDWGYSVEMAIPFSSLRFQRTDGPQVWGINIVRGRTRTRREQIWAAPYDRGQSCRVCQYLKFEGFEGAHPGRNLEINPTVTGLLTRARPDFPAGPYVTRAEDVDFGITGRWGVTPSLVLGATVNPDFSQVEADALQLDINQPFALFFEERRPFFTDGLDFFQTGRNVIYTRTIRDPSWGVKLTGKEGRHAIGAFVAEDEVTDILLPGPDGSRSTTLEESNRSGVIRYSMDLAKNSDIGAVLTHRESDSYSNTVVGLTGLARLTEKDTLTAEVYGSETDMEASAADALVHPEGLISGHALSLDFEHTTTHYTGELHVSDVDEDFRADLGFVPQVGVRSVSTRSIYQWRNTDEAAWWSSFRLLNAIWYDERTEQREPSPAVPYPFVAALPPRGGVGRNGMQFPLEWSAVPKATRPTSGRLLEKGVATSLLYVGPMDTNVFLGNMLWKRMVGGVEFDLTQFDVSFSIVPKGGSSFSIWSTFGDNIDYANLREGDRVTIGSSLGLNLGDHVELSLDHTFEQMDVEGRRYYRANISQATAVYNLSSRVFIRGIVQLVDYAYNIDNSQAPVEPKLERVFTQLLFSYEFNPRTVVYAGYSDNSHASLGVPMTRRDYTVFCKVGYAFVL